MNRVMSLIGSAGGCKFRLADPSVAPFHCSLLRSPLGLWVVDLLGPDGIGVNDTLVRYALLADNDVLKVGRYRVRIRCQFPGRDHDIVRATSRTRSPGDRSQLPAETGLPIAIPEIAGFPALSPTAWQGSLSRVFSPLGPGPQASHIEWIPSASRPGAGELARLDNGELADSVLVPLVNQFGLMQQQMMDQFQQTISMLVQMFGSLHRDQMDVIRAELDQLRDLTKEFQAIKVELADLSRVREPVASTGLSAAPGLATEASVTRGLGDRKASSNSAVGGAPVPITRASANGPRAHGSETSSAPRDHAQQGDGAASSSPRARNRAGEESQDSDRDVIVWLHERMMTLQQERETRWQKILKLLPGLS